MPNVAETGYAALRSITSISNSVEVYAQCRCGRRTDAGRAATFCGVSAAGKADELRHLGDRAAEQPPAENRRPGDRNRYVPSPISTSAAEMRPRLVAASRPGCPAWRRNTQRQHSVVIARKRSAALTAPSCTSTAFRKSRCAGAVARPTCGPTPQARALLTKASKSPQAQ